MAQPRFGVLETLTIAGPRPCVPPVTTAFLPAYSFGPSYFLSLVFEAFLDLVVPRALVEPCQHLSGFRGHVGALVVLAGEPSHRLPRVEEHDRDELHLVSFDR